MAVDNDRNQEVLRELLLFFVDKMDATQVELSLGLGISRPVVNEFLNGNKDKLPVERENLIELCEYLHSRQIKSRRKPKRGSEENSEEIAYTPGELRQLLRDIGADELLEASGLLPDKSKSIRVSTERFFQTAQVVALLELLEFEDALSTAQEFLAIARNKLAISSNKLFQERHQDEEEDDDSLRYLIEKLLKSPSTLGLKQRLDVIEKLGRRLRNGGKTNFSRQEAIALFLSILVKEQMSEKSINAHIRVQKVEFQTLSKSIEYSDEYRDVYPFLMQIGYQAECDLKTLGSCSNIPSKMQSLDSFNPVLLAIVTCSVGYNDKRADMLEFTYTSNNTMVENAISALSLQIGVTKEMKNVMMSTKALDSSINALVETTVIFKDNKDKNQYQGIWVDRDLLITVLQSIVCAAKQWLTVQISKGKLNLEVYESACKELSVLRKRLSKARKSFQSFQFIDKDSKKILTTELSNIADTARKELDKIPKEEIYFSHRLNFYRCYFLAKLQLLRLANLQGNVSEARLLLQEIEEVIEEDGAIKEELVPIRALIRSEIYLYELSCGHDLNLFDSSERDKWLNLKERELKIIEAIKLGTFYKDPGMDIYQALSEIYGNTARIEFYLSDERYVLEQAVEYFLRASHYALRIGLTQRASRWVALAGRLWVRIGNDQLAGQSLLLADKLATADLTLGHSNHFREAVRSEINLLRGEYLLLFEDNASDALGEFLVALKGAAYLGLNRRICDALFNIYRCSNKLSNLSIKEGLCRVFNENDQLTESNKSKLNPFGNHTSEQALNLLHKLWVEDGSSTFYQERERFSKLAAEIWQGWHDITSEAGVNTKHPIVERIEKGLWLGQVH
jgi:hypothetical protein